MVIRSKLAFLDFFAGSGLVSEGLRGFFEPIWANDICNKKSAVFCANHPSEIFHIGPIEKIRGSDLPSANLSWGSFPCQDLSLAGNMKGISSTRSGLVWEWLRVMDEMKEKPPIAVAENVVGLISASNGTYYIKVHEALVKRGYKVGALVIDAAYWVPQSRKRVFIVAVNRDIVTSEFESTKPLWCHPAPLVQVARMLSGWVWWALPEPKVTRKLLQDLIDRNAPCDDKFKRERLLGLLPEKHKEKIKLSLKEGIYVFPGYKRIRNGKQVLELRFDGLAGCLRTPQGGSSRQFLIIRENGSFSTRLLTVTETAALMGVRKNYKIPGSYNDGYKAMGDAVAVPVTRHLARHLIWPLAKLAIKREVS